MTTPALLDKLLRVPAPSGYEAVPGTEGAICIKMPLPPGEPEPLA